MSCLFHISMILIEKPEKRNLAANKVMFCTGKQVCLVNPLWLINGKMECQAFVLLEKCQKKETISARHLPNGQDNQIKTNLQPIRCRVLLCICVEWRQSILHLIPSTYSPTGYGRKIAQPSDCVQHTLKTTIFIFIHS